ncbi:MAG: sodium:alanine symporter family protein [Clostridiales bacterium]|nr:sodium:alanine symporter family protein [Clostridiales bacterium]
MLKIFGDINKYFSGWVLVILLVGVGLFFTIRTKFAQVRYFGQGAKQVFGNLKFKGDKQKSGMSSFQAFATAVAAQVGTGNIVGATAAILIGGPGAIFWMWIIAFLGMGTIYAEAVLAQKTKILDGKGNVLGGPVYYIKKAFPNGFGKFLAIFFAVATVIALGFVGTMVQSNSISGSVTNAISAAAGTAMPQWIALIVGIVVAVVAGIIFIGGVSRLASVTEKIVPFMALIYILGGLVILCCCITSLPRAFGMIFEYAFNPKAIIGGTAIEAIILAIQNGAKRGLFSNEAGMGSTPHAHAQANVKTAHEQGCTAMFGVFLDTFVVLTMTALIVITALYVKGGITMSTTTISDASGVAIVNPGDWFVKLNGDYQVISGSNGVATGFAVAFGSGNVAFTIGSIFVAVCLTFFAFSTILSWNLFGKINFNYLFKGKGTIVYTIIALVFIVLGAVFQNGLVWELTDFFNYLMVLPNVIALIALSKMVVEEVKTNGNKVPKNNQVLEEPDKAQVE